MWEWQCTSDREPDILLVKIIMYIADSYLHVQCIYQFTGLHQQRVYINLGAFLWKWDAMRTPQGRPYCVHEYTIVSPCLPESVFKYMSAWADFAAPPTIQKSFETGLRTKESIFRLLNWCTPFVDVSLWIICYNHIQDVHLTLLFTLTIQTQYKNKEIRSCVWALIQI